MYLYAPETHQKCCKIILSSGSRDYTFFLCVCLRSSTNVILLGSEFCPSQTRCMFSACICIKVKCVYVSITCVYVYITKSWINSSLTQRLSARLLMTGQHFWNYVNVLPCSKSAYWYPSIQISFYFCTHLVPLILMCNLFPTKTDSKFVNSIPFICSNQTIEEWIGITRDNNDVLFQMILFDESNRCTFSFTVSVFHI